MSKHTKAGPTRAASVAPHRSTFIPEVRTGGIEVGVIIADFQKTWIRQKWNFQIGFFKVDFSKLIFQRGSFNVDLFTWSVQSGVGISIPQR
jgi:hypothetical protein